MTYSGGVPDWRETTHGEAGKWYSGGTPSTSVAAYWNGETPWITSSSMHDFYINDSERRVTQKGIDNGTRLMPTDTIIFVVRGMSLKSEFRVGIAQRPVAFGQDCKAIVANKDEIDPLFLANAIRAKSEEILGLVDEASHGTGRLQTGAIQQVVIPLPPLSEQRAIAHILGSLDDKIELNRQMNQTLEEMARAIFKSWFVDFDPVHAKARGEQPAGMDAATAALFPASFEDTELGPVPTGWRIGVIGDIANNIRRSVSPEEVAADTPYIGLEHMPQRNIALSDWGRSDAVTSGKSHFEKGDILFGKLRPYFHKVGVVPITGICSTDILVVKEKAIEWFGLLLGHLSSTTFIDYTNAVSGGTKMPRTNWSDMARYQIPIPSKVLAARITDIIHPLIALIHYNIFESRTLAELRDALLPKLMSGELRVPVS